MRPSHFDSHSPTTEEMKTYLKEMEEKEEDEPKDALATPEEIEGARRPADFI